MRALSACAPRPRDRLACCTADPSPERSNEPRVSQPNSPNQQPGEETEKGFGSGLRAQLKRKSPAKGRRSTAAPAPEKAARPPKAERSSPPEIDGKLLHELARRSAEIDELAAAHEQREAELEQLQAELQAEQEAQAAELREHEQALEGHRAELAKR